MSEKKCNEILALQNGSDVRGVAVAGVDGEEVNLTTEVCNRIAQSFVKWLSEKTGKPQSQLRIGVGMDSRISGMHLLQAACFGVAAAGARVFSCGMATTPAMFMSIVFEQTLFDGSIMITASHLPFNRNGMKFCDADGALESRDIKSILEAACEINEAVPLPKEIEKLERYDLISLYAGYLRGIIAYTLCPSSDECTTHAKSAPSLRNDLPQLHGDSNLAKSVFCGDVCVSMSEKVLGGLKIIVDAGNGAGGFFAERILKPLGADITGSQFLEPDGTFPNHAPNPENKEAMEAIRSAVLKSGADLGLIFDTDVDRMSAVLSDGTILSRDAIIAMISAVLAPDNRGATIITDSVTSDRLTRFLENHLGLKHLRYMRGYKNVINKQKELCAQGINAPLAMETSGHGALKENYFLDDGAYLAVKLVIALAQAASNGKSLKDLIAALEPAGSEVELRFKINDKDFKEYGKTVLETFKARAESASAGVASGSAQSTGAQSSSASVDGSHSDAGFVLSDTYEGVRLSFYGDAEGWLLLRLSLHDPVMPLNIEGASDESVQKIKATAKSLLGGFDKLDISSLG